MTNKEKIKELEKTIRKLEDRILILEAKEATKHLTQYKPYQPICPNQPYYYRTWVSDRVEPWFGLKDPNTGDYLGPTYTVTS